MDRKPGMKLLGNRVLVEMEEEMMSVGGIWIGKRSTSMGRVLKVGSKVPKVGLEEGMRVLVKNPWSGFEWEHGREDGKNLRMMDPEEVLGIMVDSKSEGG